MAFKLEIIIKLELGFGFETAKGIYIYINKKSLEMHSVMTSKGKEKKFKVLVQF